MRRDAFPMLARCAKRQQDPITDTELKDLGYVMVRGVEARETGPVSLTGDRGRVDVDRTWQ